MLSALSSSINGSVCDVTRTSLAASSQTSQQTNHIYHKKPTKAQQKASRSKRCKSLLMLSSPFASSTATSMKSSLLSLLHPNQTQQQQQNQTSNHQDLANSFTIPSLNSNSPLLGSSARQKSQSQANLLLLSTSTSSSNMSASRAKCVKMKLFEQPLDKLFNSKAMKQLNCAINANVPTSQLAKPKRSSSSACLRKFSIDANNNNSSNQSAQALMTVGQRQQLLLAVLPEPIKNLLHELYLRGPSTVGIFRKSPNAKHCKELRQKLEQDSQGSIEQFQVTVIASVFKVSTHTHFSTVQFTS